MARLKRTDYEKNNLLDVYLHPDLNLILMKRTEKETCHPEKQKLLWSCQLHQNLLCKELDAFNSEIRPITNK